MIHDHSFHTACARSPGSHLVTSDSEASFAQSEAIEVHIDEDFVSQSWIHGLKFKKLFKLKQTIEFRIGWFKLV